MLSEIIEKYNVILASQSPRRQQLLSEIIQDFKIEVREIDEIYPEGLTNPEIAEYLSKLKSNAFDLAPNSEDMIITSDTIVCIDNEVLGKPNGRQDAFHMLKKLNGRTHFVITGVTLKTREKIVTFSDTTKVTFYEMSDEEIYYYLDKCHPFDKAGSYGIQEWWGYVGIQKMEGEFYNVMGLPLHRLYIELKKF